MSEVSLGIHVFVEQSGADSTTDDVKASRFSTRYQSIPLKTQSVDKPGEVKENRSNAR